MSEIFTGNREAITLFILGQTDTEALWDITPHKEKRSLDSNAYFHVLCDKLRQKLNMSMARCKNHLIADYGQMEYIDNEPMVYKTNAPEEYMMELETIHTKCVKATEENGKPVFFYRIYRPTHTYNSAEFAKLLEGTIAECKAQDIQTATPKELEHMQYLWEQRYGKKYNAE
jgi:hypothetical protein